MYEYLFILKTTLNRINNVVTKTTSVNNRKLPKAAKAFCMDYNYKEINEKDHACL
jgi:hypothetical protein